MAWPGRFVTVDHDDQKKNAVIACRRAASGIGLRWIAYCARKRVETRVVAEQALIVVGGGGDRGRAVLRNRDHARVRVVRVAAHLRHELRLQRGLRGRVEVGVALAGLALCPGVEHAGGFTVQPVRRPVGRDVAAVAPDRSELVTADRLPYLAARLDVGAREEGLSGHGLYRGRHGRRGEVDLAAEEQQDAEGHDQQCPQHLPQSTRIVHCSLRFADRGLAAAWSNGAARRSGAP